MYRVNPKVKKVRIDELVFARGFASSRSQARALVMSGKVRAKGQVVDKPSRMVAEDVELNVIEGPRFVSRSGEKLKAFLEAFEVVVEGFDILDVGASTGGFTDCLLQRGAASATCVDVGHGQLHYKLRVDERVTNLEKVNARYLSEVTLPFSEYDLICMDLSFISLKKVFGSVWGFLKPGSLLVALVKPQFEADKKAVDRGRGVIRDATLRIQIFENVKQFALENLSGSEFVGSIESPILGSDGNLEFLMGLRKQVEEIV